MNKRINRREQTIENSKPSNMNKNTKSQITLRREENMVPEMRSPLEQNLLE